MSTKDCHQFLQTKKCLMQLFHPTKLPWIELAINTSLSLLNQMRTVKGGSANANGILFILTLPLLMLMLIQKLVGNS